MKPIELINSKINKLDGIFAKLELVKPTGRPESYEIKPDVKTREAIALAKGKLCLGLESDHWSIDHAFYFYQSKRTRR